MAPSVDKSVVVLCHDDVGLWAPSIPDDSSAADRSSTGPHQAQRFLPWILVMGWVFRTCAGHTSEVGKEPNANNLSRRAPNRDVLLTEHMCKLPDVSEGLIRPAQAGETRENFL